MKASRRKLAREAKIQDMKEAEEKEANVKFMEDVLCLDPEKRSGNLFFVDKQGDRL